MIFLDLHLPSVHGLDVLRSIKAKERLQEIPVIVLSNSIDPEDRASAYGLQAGGFISKSFAFDEFKDRLVKAISYWTDVVMDKCR